ncbi:MAG TPA: DUF4433 domain-containing protein [Thermoanaerobaculia bacterium]|jgi:hypothetical protein|nr:DUF4433 domain-containing protein [Thermoanaerobaculia bacterium]
MPPHPLDRLIFHITDIENLPDILDAGGLHSDFVMSMRNPMVIGHNHIKQRRLTQIRIPTCGNRFVGEFVPFYFCARSPMLYTVNLGNTGRTPGCQKTIVHLVSRVRDVIALGTSWAVSDGNAGAFHTTFDSTMHAVDNLDWKAIEATYWTECIHQKQAELLVADFFPWTCFHEVGCYDAEAEVAVKALLANQNHRPKVSVKKAWYY